MRILFDTNVVLDVLLRREPHRRAALRLLARVETGRLTGQLCATTVTTLHDLISKALGAARAREEIRKLLGLFEIASVHRTVLDAAARSPFADFEDAVLSEAAREAGAEGLVTRNTKDFQHARLPVYTPDELLAAFEA